MPDSAPTATSPLGVILAAGKGTRMGIFSKRWPKPVLPIAGRPLLTYQLEMLHEVGVTEVLIVVGHLGHEIVRQIGDGSRFGLRIDYVEQEETLGIAHAVLQLADRIRARPFFLFLGDIFFETTGLEPMWQRLQSDRGVAGVLAVKPEPDVDALRRNFTVDTDPADHDVVQRVREKPRRVTTDRKGCGIYLFRPQFLDAVRATPRTAMRDEFEITDSIQLFLDSGARVEAAQVVERDLNLSYAPDLLRLNLHVLARERSQRYVAASARVHPDARIEDTVILDDVSIDAPITIRRSILFPGTRVPAHRNAPIEDTILTPDFEMRCDPDSPTS